MSATPEYFRPEVLNRIARLELRARVVVEGFLSGQHRSPYRGFSVEFADHRPYVPGDDLRHLDWRVYAKSDRFYIKEYEVETNLRTVFLLDCSASMLYPERIAGGRMNKWTYAATVAASLAYLLVSQQDAAGLVLFDRELRGQFPPSASPAGLQRLVELIAATEPRGGTDTRAMFERLADLVPHRSLVVVVSDLLGPLADILTGLQRLRFCGHDVIVLQVLDQDELVFPFAARTQFEGLEDAALRVRTDPQALRAAYLERLHAFLTALRGACLNQRIDYALLSTADPLDGALTSFLGRRMRLTRARA